MSDEQVTLDQWASETMRQTEPARRELVDRFRKEWANGATQNPALYPLSLSSGAWRDHFEWFLTIYQFDTPATEPVSTEGRPLAEVKTGVVEKTVAYESSAPAEQLETTAMDAPPTPNKTNRPPGDTAVSAKPKLNAKVSAAHSQLSVADELDELGSLITQGHAEQIQSPPNADPASSLHSGKTGKIGRSTPNNVDYQSDLDDLGSLIREAETQKKTVNKGKLNSHQLAVASGKASGQDAHQAGSKSTIQTNEDTKPPLASTSKPGSEQPGDGTPPEDLDLGDLDKMS